MPTSTTILQNSPVLELIAEVRWHHELASEPQLQAGAQIGIAISGSQHEDIFKRFAGLAGSFGFYQQERLIPHGFPIVVGEPVMRFRSEKEPGVIYQIGLGIFSVNATQPYKSWTDFSPFIEQGFNAVTSIRRDMGDDAPFLPVSLRYIDAFQEPLLQNQEMHAFLAKSLGVEISLPRGITKNLAGGKHCKPSLRLEIPMENEMTMQISIGEGMVHQQRTVILDSVVVNHSPIASEVDALMNTLNQAHSVLHDMFFEVTEPIMNLMKPIQGA